MNNIMGKRIRERRDALGLTLEEIADRLGLQRSAISKYERGEVENIKRSNIIKMAQMLECSPAYLMGFTDSINGDSEDAYFFDDYARELAQFIHDNPEYRTAFSAARKVPPEDLEAIIAIINKNKGVQ